MSAAQSTSTLVTLEDVLAAADRIRGFAKVTPLLTSRLFDQRAGCSAVFKCENLQRCGAFKIRGALNFIAQLNQDERRRGVVSFSSGNHAQAVAMAAEHLGVSATIVMPTDAPRAKLASTQAYRPKIVLYDRHTEDRETITAQIAQETGAITLPSYDHPWIIAGQATATLELLNECPDLAAIAVPLGGGGLLSGALTVVRAMRPDIVVYGVEPELANDWYLSLQHGKRVRIQPPGTIADGLRTPEPGALTFPLVQQLGGLVELVSEGEMQEAVRFLLTRLKMLVEPSGAAAAAAVLFGKISAVRGSVGIILSGGNVDLDTLASICAEGISSNA